VLALDDILVKPMFIESHRLAPFKDRGTDVDVILDIMIHDIDIILTIVGAPVTAVHAVGVPVLSRDKNDIANVRLEFETGCIANITASRISLKEMRKLRIFQTNTYLSVDYAAQHLDVYRKISSSETTDMPQITYDQIEITQHDALNEEVRSFVDAVANRTRPRVPGEAGRDALRVALEIVDQIHSRQAALHV
jgi:predicted dehydrogenase